MPENDLRRVAPRKIVSAMRAPATGGPRVPQDIVRRLDFTFFTDPVDAILKALGL
jgi:predicted ATP-dependent Lon-type protease